VDDAGQSALLRRGTTAPAELEPPRPAAPGTPGHADLAVLLSEEYRLLEVAKDRIRRELELLKACGRAQWRCGLRESPS
jgi:hypothetical protein